MSDRWIAYTNYDQVETFATEAEAVEVLKGWDQLWEDSGRPGHVGDV